jgi:dynein heavy chain
MKPAGMFAKRTALIINDNQITDNSFLEDVNNVLNSGEIPNLWEDEEKSEILNEMRAIGAEYGVYEAYENFFVQRVREYLHIILCLSPVGEEFRKRIRMFPSLVNCCTIDWFDPWPEDALLSVSSRFIEKIDDLNEEGLRESLSQVCVYVHTSVEEESTNFFNSLKRRVYITPKSYLDLIKCYSIFLFEKRSELSGRRNTLALGLSKLEETNADVGKLENELIELKPILETNVVEQEKLSKELEAKKVEANKVKVVVEEEARVVEEKAYDIKILQNQAQERLDEALPALENAQKAVNTLNQGDIAELKIVNEPTPMVLTTFTAVAILIEERADYKKIKWADIKKMLASDFFNRLKSYDKDKIPQKVINALDKFVEK